MAESDDYNSIKNVLGDVLKKKKMGIQYHIIHIRKIWIDVVGDKLAEMTEPARYYDGTLYIDCAHQGISQSMGFYKDEIIKKITEDHGIDLPITEIVFRQKK